MESLEGLHGGGADLRGAGRVLVGLRPSEARSKLVAALEASGFAVCAESDDLASAVERACTERPDVALLHSDVPAASIAAARDILRRDELVSVVLLDDDIDDDALFSALEAGVAGVLPLDVDPARVPRILRGVLAGEAAIPRTTMARVLREFSARSARAPKGEDGPHLSPRQQEVLELLASGMSTSEIANALFIAGVTVRTHVLAILRLLDLPDRAAAVEYFTGRR